MTYTVSVTEDQIFTALRAWLMQAVSGQVVQGYINRVSSPTGDFIEMAGLVKRVLSSNTRLYLQPVDPSPTGFQVNQQSIDYQIQLDAYGPTAGDTAAILSTAFHSDRAWPFFAALVPGLAPLYMEDPRQAPLVTGEQQYEQRWTMVIHMQYKPAISDTQESATEVVIAGTGIGGINNVDAEYPG